MVSGNHSLPIFISFFLDWKQGSGSKDAMSCRMQGISWPSVHTSLHPFACPSIPPSVHLSVCPSVRPSVRPSIHPSVHPSVCPSVCQIQLKILCKIQQRKLLSLASSNQKVRKKQALSQALLSQKRSFYFVKCSWRFSFRKMEKKYRFIYLYQPFHQQCK